jgi:hypothetical protein
VNDTSLVGDALAESLDGIEPAPFRERLDAVLDGTSLTPAVLVVKSARALDPGVDAETSALRGAGVQLSYEGLRLTRSLLREKEWEHAERTPYNLDLLASGTLVSRGFHELSETGVAMQAVDIVRRFGRDQTNTLAGEDVPDTSLESDVVKLAVNAGADLALQSVPPSVGAFAETLAAELEAEPLPDPNTLGGIEDRFATAARAPPND